MGDPRAYQESWQDRALCAGIPERVFFFVEGSRPEPLKIRRAKQFCQACPVRRECLRYALKHETAGSLHFGFAQFLQFWRKTCNHKECIKHYVKDDKPEIKWREFRASSTPAEGIYGGSTPSERHRKHIKHVELRLDSQDKAVCVKGRICPGCRDLDEWTDMVMEETG